jgi:nucleoside-diphosphate-sugar epimerase
MNIFVTGATGYIGSAVVRDLLDAGHQVVGLARTDSAAAALAAADADVHRGALDDLASLRDGAATADGVIHLAFNDISLTTDFAAACQEDLHAAAAIGAALEDSGKPFVITSGTLMLASLGRLGTEEDVLDPAIPRVASENATIAMAGRGVRSSVVRLAPSVHGEGDRHGFVPTLIGIARACMEPARRVCRSGTSLRPSAAS